MLLLMTLTSWAGSADAVLRLYPHLSKEQVALWIELEPIAESEAPEGLALMWSSYSGYAGLGLANDSANAVTLDWEQSNFVYEDGRSVGLVPARTSEGEAQRAIPPLTIPPGARYDEMLVRRTATQLGAPVPLVELSDVGQEVRMTLAFPSEESTQYVTERFQVGVNKERLSAWNLNRMTAQVNQQRILDINQEMKDIRSGEDVQRKWGVGMLAAGGVTVLGSGTGETTGEQAAIAGTGAVLAGIGAGILTKRKRSMDSLQSKRQEVSRLTVKNTELNDAMVFDGDTFSRTGLTLSGEAVVEVAPPILESPHLAGAEGFRSYAWGTTRADIQQAEGEPKAAGDNLVYTGEVAGLDVIVAYIFVNDQLARGRYVVIEEHSSENSFISDFNKLKALLTKKYGPSTGDKSYWINDLYEDDPSYWGFAVSLGHHSQFAGWETSFTDVGLGLYGDNYKISLVVDYSSKVLAPALDDLVEQENLEGL